jgi:hypothetical protein
MSSRRFSLEDTLVMKVSSALRAGSLLVAALIARPALAEQSWTLGVGAQADESGANSADADIGWTPTSAFTFALAAGRVNGDSDTGDFAATTATARVDWQPIRQLGFAVAYDTWDDPSAFEKRTAHAAIYVGGPSFRVGLLGETIASETTAELAVLRRRTSLAFDGSGYGIDVQVSGSRTDVYATYMSYDYKDNVDRLINFLSSPTLVRRPRIEALLSSGLTAAGALLDDSLTVGADVFVRQTRIGIAFAQFRDIVDDADIHTLQADVEWPLTARWSANVIAGMSDSDATDTTLFGGARLLFHSR